MSTQPIEAPAINLELIVGEMPEQHCESPRHHNGPAHDIGPATHYMLIGHECYGPVDGVIAACSLYASHWSDVPELIHCRWCNAVLGPPSFNQVLGPVK